MAIEPFMSVSVPQKGLMRAISNPFGKCPFCLKGSLSHLGTVPSSSSSIEDRYMCDFCGEAFSYFSSNKTASPKEKQAVSQKSAFGVCPICGGSLQCLATSLYCPRGCKV